MAVQIAGGLEHPPLLVLLADGELHSGESLARRLGVTRAAVWKGIERLRALGIVVHARARRGYQLPQAVDLLDAARILRELRPACGGRLRQLELLFEVDSSNSRLLQAKPPPVGCADVCMTELQHAGRGRLGRPWLAPFGCGIAMSVAWTFRESARALPALSLGVGVAAARALRRVGARDIALKWPNDIWYADRKVGGILVEIRADAGGPAHVVIGIGANVCLPEPTRAQIEALGLQAASVAEACDARPERNVVAGALLDELLSMLTDFEDAGFGAFRDEWSRLDGLSGRAVRVMAGEKSVQGLARGVDVDGALLLECGSQVLRIVSGEASLRLSER